MIADETRLEILNWDDECQKDIVTGKALIIKERPFKKHLKKDVKNLHGSHSPFFCSDWGDESSFEELYTCLCKDIQGRIYEGESCTKCMTKVERREVDFAKTGWTIMKEHKVVHPAYYKLLKSFIGETQLVEMLKFDRAVTLDGGLERRPSAKNKFKGIGIEEFYERFEEILIFYRFGPKKNKSELYELLIANKESVFTSCIPVYSSALRPVVFKGESLFYTPIDRAYNYIFSLVTLLNKRISGASLSRYSKKRQSLDIPSILYQIQKKVIDYFETVFIDIHGKEGWIKGDILGGRMNFSSRNVIIPDPDLAVDEVRLSYWTFIVLYQYEICSHLCIMNNITMIEAESIWKKASIVFNKKVYEIMVKLVDSGPVILINRNPTLNYGSILCMRVVEVKKGFTDYTMSIPIQILKVLNADFDGDVLNIVSIKTKSLIDVFMKSFNPKLSMFISRNDGLFNNDFNLLKDQSIGLYQFCNY